MNGAGHLGISAAGGALVGLASGSPEMGAGFLLSGWLVDLDHIPDFVGTWGWREGLRRLASLRRQEPHPRSVYLPLHAYEWVPLCGFVAWLYPSNPWLLGAVLGYLLHLFIDQVANAPRRLSYFLLYRFRKGFSHAAVFPNSHAPEPGSKVVPRLSAQSPFIPRPVQEEVPLRKGRGVL